MDKKDLRIVFFGTPEFAVESLDALIKNDFNVVGVVTMPDKIAGRGHKLYQSDVKRYAVEHDLPLLQPEKLKSEDFINALRALEADLFIVIAFRMLPREVWQMPRLGTFNLHASLLPKYRGAAPINRAVMNGDTETGVTTFFLKHEIDTGDMIMQRKIDILPEDNVGDVHDRLMHLGAGMVVETVNAIVDDEAIAVGGFREDSGTVDAPIGRCASDRKKMAVTERGGRPAVTHWEVLERFSGGTHLRCRLETGRTHQIRVHLASIGHPILGDTVYGAKKPVPGLTGQCLHAAGLRFVHPRTGEAVELRCPLDGEFQTMLEKMRRG